MSNWKDKLNSLGKSAQINIEDEFQKALFLKTGEAALVGNSVTDGNGTTPTIICRDNGSIELFASSNVGIRLDPKMESISLIAPNINIKGNVVDIATRPFMGLRWNKKPLNLTPTLTGISAAGLVEVFPGTLLPYDSTIEDSVAMIPKLLKGLVI